MPAMVVNDNACGLVKRGALESIASRLAPTRRCHTLCARPKSPVGAGLPAMVVNDNACGPVKRGALEFIASKLAPTGCAFAGLACKALSWVDVHLIRIFLRFLPL
ncbi:hypothetical protein EKG40_25425 [Pseudomonas moorei]|nr:hypothetical protein EKG40_25425 [Pseudomonas moorei]